MHQATGDSGPAGGLTRRALVVAGGVGAAALWLGPGWSVVDGVASAATRQAELRRSGWLQTTDAAVRASGDGWSAGLRVIGVFDLPIAEQLPALRDHEAAFVVRFEGPVGLDAGIWSFEHAELGGFALFTAAVERAASGRQLYEAVVDRTVKIAGVTDEPVPTADQVVVPDARAALPAASAPLVGAVPPALARTSTRTTRGPRPRIQRLRLSRGSGRRTVLVEATWANARHVTAVHALLVAKGRVVARAGGPVRRLARLRLRLTGRRGVPSGRYELRLTAVDRDGRVTRIRRTVRVP